MQNLKKLLDKETHLGRGIHTINLSPYSIVIQTIYNQKSKAFQNAISSKQLQDGHYYRDKKVVITPEMGIVNSGGVNAVFLPEKAI